MPLIITTLGFDMNVINTFIYSELSKQTMLNRKI